MKDISVYAREKPATIDAAKEKKQKDGESNVNIKNTYPIYCMVCC